MPTPNGLFPFLTVKFPIVGASGNSIGIGLIATDITERKRSEEKLKESEERFRALFENAPISIREDNFSKIKARIDALGIATREDFIAYLDDHPALVEECAQLIDVVNANEACLELHDAEDKADFLSSFTKNFTDQALTTLKEVLVAMHGGETDLSFEAIASRPDGSTRDVAARWSVVAGHEKTYARILFTSVDITERKRAEEALRESEERFAKTFQSAPVLIAITHPEEGWFYDVNDTWLSTMGYTRGEVIGKTTTDLAIWVDPSHRSRVTEALENEAAGALFEARFRTKNGDMLDCLAAVERIEVGSEARLIFVTQDITERKRAEEALHNSEHRYRDLVEGGTALIIRFNPDTTLTFVNTAYAVQRQTSPRELIGQKSIDFLPDDEKNELLAYLASFTIDRPVKSTEFRVRQPDGTIHWRSWTHRAFFDEDGEVREFQGVGTDITERKRTEDQIKTSLAEKEVLLQEIHHRVKNNLQVITSMLSLQAGAETDNHSVEVLKESQRRVGVMARIHETLHQSDDLASVNARDYLDTLVEDTKASSGQNAQGISFNLEADDTAVRLTERCWL